MAKNDDLYENAINAINKLFSDISVDKQTTIGNLEGLMDEIQTLKSTLE